MDVGATLLLPGGASSFLTRQFFNTTQFVLQSVEIRTTAVVTEL